MCAVAKVSTAYMYGSTHDILGSEIQAPRVKSATVNPPQDPFLESLDPPQYSSDCTLGNSQFLL